ncbi:MAG: hypothetical protein COW73_11365 [Nitrospirae bacterium CG18_big_fil_WC_8_21_14_2_50_70_55]|nr:MAG: hypothetical protein AUK30_00405 [Nitrospirae bacterium CG2_30_70_394]PIQ03345.1 MAG: hypothetical protein COW73_11365 [Nitrospirae bacterium CG18_big_fil_WC_8_21_14_2_50_70_55]PIU79267.1 MAG: hypothetical protein COS73_04485 [Nitrospirae bacterium CG06_land_8_20_14_3_00_70_43]PIW82262.1 MAG: hypothetical protein COZ96_09625 [Nitrospirae bacterium CG_4_8_14_3_um_filter_70_85]PIX83122.1 MAG: hypothetical protein COZ33_07095 [Nitrospirae bacterium CG_4_10_14_3_um_filter_70_108]PJB96120.1
MARRNPLAQEGVELPAAGVGDGRPQLFLAGGGQARRHRDQQQDEETQELDRPSRSSRAAAGARPDGESFAHPRRPSHLPDFGDRRAKPRISARAAFGLSAVDRAKVR